MTRLLIAAEGLTEVNFATQLLKPHLVERAPDRITVSAPNLRGYHTYAAIRRFVKDLLTSPDSGAIVTTMIDLFKIPGDFPGLAEASPAPPAQRVRQLEECFTKDVDDPRFFAYLQLHEFEALLLADLTALSSQHPKRRKELASLAARLNKDFASPELVDRLRPPSYWIKETVPEYDKKLDGPVTAATIGLPKLRERCPHFGEWLKRLEDLAALPTPHPTHSPS